MKILASILGLALVLASAGTARAYITTSPGGGGSSGGPTNGQTAAQVNSLIAASAVLQASGAGTNTSLGTLTVLNGAYKNFYLADGSYLRTNTIAPFDWHLKRTNGQETFGTNGTTLGIIGINGTYVAANGTLSVSNGALTGNVYIGATAGAGTNVLQVDTSATVKALEVSTNGTVFIPALASTTIDGPASGNLSIEAAASHSIRFNFGGTPYYNVDTNQFAPFPDFDGLLDLGGSDRRWRTNYSAYFVGDGSGLTGISGGGSVPNGLVTNSAAANIISSGSLLASGGQFNQLRLTNSTDASIPIARFNSITNSAGEVAVEIEASTNGNTSPVTLQGAGGLTFKGTGNFTTLTATTANVTTLGATTLWATNTIIPTNAFVGTVVDFAQGYGSTNLGGNITFTDVANVTAGGHNTAIRRLYANGADRIVAFPASWHSNYNFIGVVTNGWQMDLLVTVTGSRTNVAQILYP